MICKVGIVNSYFGSWVKRGILGFIRIFTVAFQAYYRLSKD